MKQSEQVPTKKQTVPMWLAQAFEQRAQHEANCAWSREACVCSCGLFELRLHLANAMAEQSSGEERYKAHVEMEQQAHAQKNEAGTPPAI